MTEAEWLACIEPSPMLRFLRGKVSDRKLRCFIIACCRRKWDTTWEESKALVVTAERAVEGLVTEAELRHSHRTAYEWLLQGDPDIDADAAFYLVPVLGLDSTDLARKASQQAAEDDSDWLPGELRDVKTRQDLDPPGRFPVSYLTERSVQAACFRDIVPNPSRPSTIDPALLRWNNATIPQIAQVIYDERELPSGHLDAGKLGILADALIEAGCTNEDILGHCRRKGPHVRGCWVVDLILAKG